MIQVKIFAGNTSTATEKYVNSWLADRLHDSYDIKDIKFTYNNGYCGAMIVYDSEPLSDKLQQQTHSLSMRPPRQRTDPTPRRG